jgi:hypothetical protein
MTYRDDLDAAHERIGALERELADARRELGESQALARVERRELVRAERGAAATRWFGAPTRIQRERVLDVVAPESCYLAIVQYLERQFEIGGRTSTLSGRLEWVTTPPSGGTGPFITVTVTVVGGTTTIRVEERTGSVAGVIFGGIGGGVGGGSLIAPGALFIVNPLLGALAVSAWLGGWYVGCRRIYTRMMRKRARRAHEAVQDIAEIVEAAAAVVEEEGRAAIAAGGRRETSGGRQRP